MARSCCQAAPSPGCVIAPDTTSKSYLTWIGTTRPLIVRNTISRPQQHLPLEHVMCPPVAESGAAQRTEDAKQEIVSADNHTGQEPRKARRQFGGAAVLLGLTEDGQESTHGPELAAMTTSPSASNRRPPA